MCLQLKNIGQLQIWEINDQNNMNSLGLKIFEKMNEALIQIEESCTFWTQDPDKNSLKIKMLVITATPLKSSKSTVWIAGGNLKDIANLKSKEKGLEYASNYSELCRRFLKLPIPVIMSIDGAAIGGGAEFTLFGDLRIMTSRSTIQFKQLEMGLPCGFGGSSRLVQIVGNSRAMRWLFFGEKISADESIQSGFAHGVMSRHEESMSFIEDLMKRLDHIDPLAFAVQKNMLNKSQIDAADVHSYELNEFTKLWMETGHRKALKDFFARTHQNDTLNSEN